MYRANVIQHIRLHSVPYRASWYACCPYSPSSRYWPAVLFDRQRHLAIEELLHAARETSWSLARLFRPKTPERRDGWFAPPNLSAGSVQHCLQQYVAIDDD